MDYKPSILIVDDEAGFRKTLSDILKIKGYDPTAVDQGESALAQIRERAPIAALIDLKLEDMSGLVLLKEIKKHSPSTACILLTGHASQSSAIEAVNLGAYGYLQKPYEIEQLLLMLRRAIEQRDAEVALRDSEDRFRQVISSVSDHIYSAEITPDNRYINPYHSPNIDSLTGYPLENFAKDWFFWASAVIHPDDREAASAQLLDLEEGRGSEIEYRIVRADGQVIWVRDSARVEYNGNARIIYGVVSDITERKRAQAAEREQRELAETLREVTSILNSSLNREQVLSLILEQLARVVDYDGASVMLLSDDKIENVSGKSTRKRAFATRLNVDTLPHIKQVIKTRKPVIISDTTIEKGWLQIPGTEQIRSWLGVPLIVQNRVIGLLNVNKEIPGFYTAEKAELALALANQAAIAVENAQLFEQARQEIKERIRAEAELEAERESLTRRVSERTSELSAANAELARAARLKDEFLASMSHELRTPLNAILGLSEALQEEVYGSLNSRQHKSLATVEESGRHLLSLINDILDISKVEAGKLLLDIGPISVEAVCQSSLRLIKQVAYKKQLKVTSTLDSGVTVIQADQRRLKQILVNLLSNAVKFTPEGGTIGLDVEADPINQVVTFTVWDTGMGIAPEELQRLFKPFVQLDSSLSRQYGGTGLGLALVRRLTELHNGGISLESQVNKGSRFIVTLPWSNPSQADQNGLETAIVEQKADFSAGYTALIIEDSPTAADQLSRYLAECGLQTVVHDIGEGSIEKVLALQPNVIILDILLPDKFGWEILTQLKKHPQTKTIPVLIVSVVDEQEHGLKLGAAGYLVKPTSRQQLKAALSRVLPSDPVAFPFQVSRHTSTFSGLSSAVEPTILLAEDNDHNINTLIDYLPGKGYKLIIARNGAEAISRAREDHPDLILMDIQMPGMDGLEAMRRLKADTTMASTPIIALTALTMPGDRERCLTAGANAYLSKPVSLKKLINEIETQLHQQQNKVDGQVDG